MFGENAKSKALTIAITCAIVGVAAYLTINVAAIGKFISSILSVCSPIILGGTFAFMLNPLLKLFEFKILKKIRNTRVLRALSLVLTYVVALIVIVSFTALILPALIRSITDLASKMDTYLFSTAQYVNGIIVKLTKSKEFSQLISTESILAIVSKFFSFSGNVFDTILSYLAKYGPQLVSGLKNILLGLFISVYILISKERLKAQFRKLSVALFRKGSRKKAEKYIRIAHRTFGNFFVGKSIDSLIILFICLIIFSIADIPYAPLIAVIVGVANFVPVFGPVLGAIPSFIIIFIANPSKALIFIILILLILIIDGNIIAPKILGDSTGISSLGVITAIILGAYFGIVGMIVAVPIFATLTAIVTDIVNSKLRKSELPTDIAEYYGNDSLVDPHEVHETFSQRIVKNIVSIAMKFAKIFKVKSKKENDQAIDEKTKQKEDETNE